MFVTPPVIRTEQAFIAFCVKDGWPRIAIPRLRKAWREHSPNSKRNKIRGIFIIKYLGYILPFKFSTRWEASKWGLYNYRGSKVGWKVIAYDKRKHGIFGQNLSRYSTPLRGRR